MSESGRTSRNCQALLAELEEGVRTGFHMDFTPEEYALLRDAMRAYTQSEKASRNAVQQDAPERVAESVRSLEEGGCGSPASNGVLAGAASSDKYGALKRLHEAIRRLAPQFKTQFAPQAWDDIPSAEKDCVAAALEEVFPSAEQRGEPVPCYGGKFEDRPYGGEGDYIGVCTICNQPMGAHRDIQAIRSHGGAGQWADFDARYRKACESSQPEDWMQAALAAQRVRSESTVKGDKHG